MVMLMCCCFFKCSSKKLVKCEVSNYMFCFKMLFIIFSGVNEGYKINSEYVFGILVLVIGVCMWIMIMLVGLVIVFFMVFVNEFVVILIYSGLCVELCFVIVCICINNEIVFEDEEEKLSYFCLS